MRNDDAGNIIRTITARPRTYLIVNNWATANN